MATSTTTENTSVASTVIPSMASVQAAFQPTETVPATVSDGEDVAIDTEVQRTVAPVTAPLPTSGSTTVPTGPALTPVQTPAQPMHSSYASAVGAGVAPPTSSAESSSGEGGNIRVYYKGDGAELGRYYDNDGNQVVCVNDFVLANFGDDNDTGRSVVLSGPSATTAFTRFWKGVEAITLSDGTKLTLSGLYRPKYKNHPNPCWRFSLKDKSREETAALIMLVLNAIVSGADGFEPRMHVKKVHTQPRKQPKRKKQQQKKQRNVQPIQQAGAFGIPTVQMSGGFAGTGGQQVTVNIEIPRIHQRVHVSTHQGTVEYIVIDFDQNNWQIKVAQDTSSTSCSLLDYVVGRGWQARGFMVTHSINFV